MSNGKLSPEELGLTLELANLISGSATSTLSMLMDPGLVLGQPDVLEYESYQQFLAEGVSSPSVLAVLSFINGYETQVGYMLNLPTAVAMAEAMMGGASSGAADSINDIQLSAVGEAISQMMAASANSISQFLSKQIDITAPEVVQFSPEELLRLMPSITDAPVIVIQYKISGSTTIPNTELLQVIPLADLRKQLDHVEQDVSVDNTFDPAEIARSEGNEQPFDFPQLTPQAPLPEPAGVGAATADPYQMADYMASQQPASGGPVMGYEQPTIRQTPANPVTVSPVEFASFDQHVPVSGAINKNLELVLDVSLNLTVELGRTELSIKDVLELTRGSVIELDRIAGEPVDLLANGKMIAKGEVVVIEDNFGLRITNIVAPADRLRGL